MTLTIYEGYDNSYVIVKEAGKRNGLNWKVNTHNLYKELSNISWFINNELGEECLFEVD